MVAGERRRYPRVSVKFSVEYRGKNIWQNAEAYNLSQRGVFIATERIEPPGTRIEILFEVGKEDVRRIHVDATVVWTRQKVETIDGGGFLPAGMGIKFEKIFPSDGEAFLKEMIAMWEQKDE